MPVYVHYLSKKDEVDDDVVDADDDDDVAAGGGEGETIACFNRFQRLCASALDDATGGIA